MYKSETKSCFWVAVVFFLFFFFTPTSTSCRGLGVASVSIQSTGKNHADTGSWSALCESCWFSAICPGTNSSQKDGQWAILFPLPEIQALNREISWMNRDTVQWPICTDPRVRTNNSLSWQSVFLYLTVWLKWGDCSRLLFVSSQCKAPLGHIKAIYPA